MAKEEKTPKEQPEQEGNSENPTSDKKLDGVVSFQFNVPTIGMSELAVNHEALALIPETVALELSVLPIKLEDDILTIVTENPDDLQLIDTLAVLTHKRVTTVAPDGGGLRETITKHYQEKSEIYDDTGETVMDIIAPVEDDAGPTALPQAMQAASDAPIVRAVDLILTQAVKERASDIHISPEENSLKVRYRTDGILHDSISLPPGVQSALLTRLKILANMNIAERRRPQDGSFTGRLAGKEIDFRVATIGTNWGEAAVLRVLDKTFSLFELEKIGMPPYFMESYEACLASPFGMIVISGPTGSGKTTTLYASLLKLNATELNIMSIEDPVEYKFPGVRQIQVNRLADVTFASGLRACMRMDPDVILVGEIRDAETAQTAVTAALTGHLVLTSIHANDSVGALVRLVDLGVEPFLVTSAVIATASQRLARRVCSECGELKKAPLADSMAYKQVTGKEKSEFFYGSGCPACHFTGYRGRVGVFELLPISDSIRSLVTRDAGASEIKEQALKEGMLAMRYHGMSLAREGVTTPGEVARHVFTIG